MKYEITAISDSTMTWEMTDSLSTISDESPLPPEHYKLKFSRKIGVPFPKQAEGFWKTETTTKVTYDASGNIINTEAVANETKAVDMYGSRTVFIYWNENEEHNGGYYYMLHEDAGKTNLVFYDRIASGIAFEVEVTSITDSKMTWEKKESPTVSYITEFTKLAVPETGLKVAEQIKGEWIQRYSLVDKNDKLGHVIGTDTSYLTTGWHYILDGRTMSIFPEPDDLFENSRYSIFERENKTYISIVENESEVGYEVTQVSDTSMTWVPADKPFLGDSPGGYPIVFGRSK